MQARHFIACASAVLFLAVACGAFGAHALKAYLTADRLAIWQTAVLYQFIHGLGCLAIGVLLEHKSSRCLKLSGWSMLAGIVLFSGSLYLLALTGVRELGIITPIGGLAFLAAWSLLGLAAMRKVPTS
ncbi:MAG: DUF423 domain-containing protein [Burkholderiaceae bacterium]|nr:DUF423 domain-containing protein [Burkholderiaceae bacterium]